VGAVAILVVAAGAFAAIYLTVFNPRHVAAVSLPTASPVPSGSTTAAALGGSWRVSAGSFVGYRVREQLANLPAPSDAVGRSSAVTGAAAVTTNADGTATVRSIEVSADLGRLASDSARRDNFVRNNSLSTAQFPQATFTSTSSFTCPAAVVAGAAGTASVTGKLTVHGVTRDVAIPLKIQRSGNSVNVVGSYGFRWGDFAVQQPQVPIASVQDDPVIEISLVLTSA